MIIMGYKNEAIEQVSIDLKVELATAKDKRSVLRSPKLKALYEQIKNLPTDQRSSFGAEVNALRSELENLIAIGEHPPLNLPPIDVSAPFDANTSDGEEFGPLPAKNGSTHPLMGELSLVLDILNRMGFAAHESREIDDDWHMFTSLNFPPDHPARDDYDTFVTDEGLVAPAHTSTMQNRVLQIYKPDLEAGKGIRVVIPGRVFRNEDLDARHEHTFYQLEGVCVDKGIHAGHLIATLKAFLSEYYQQSIEVKTQPFYFPFTEPSFEFALSCPFCQKRGCNTCSQTGWIELLGCGMIHPNVLAMAGIDSQIYTGFAWGGGIDRLVMMKYGIEDIRHFESGNLRFLRQFK